MPSASPPSTRVGAAIYFMAGAVLGLAVPFVFLYGRGLPRLLPLATWWLFWPTALLGLSSFLRDHVVLEALIIVGGNGLLYGFIAKVLRRGCAILVAALIFVVWVVSPPSDTALSQRFFKARPELEALAKMAVDDDQITELTPTLVRTLDGVGHAPREAHYALSEERWAAYQEVFSKTSVKGFFRSSRGQTFVVVSRFDAPDRIRTLFGQASRDVRFNSFADAMGMYVGYLYCPSNPRPPVGETNYLVWAGSGFAACNDAGAEFNTASYRYKKLESEWYLYEVFRKYGTE